MKFLHLPIVILLSSLQADAATLAVNLDLTGGAFTDTPQGMIGWDFSFSSAIIVESLGVYDLNGDGLMTSHEIGIWQLDGTLLTSAVVPAGVTAPLSERFRLTGVEPMTLVAGSYRIGAFFPNTTGNDRSVSYAPRATFPTPIVWQGRVFQSGETSFQFPTRTSTVNPFANFGPVFTYSIPEPSCMALFCFAAAFGLGRPRFGAHGGVELRFAMAVKR